MKTSTAVRNNALKMMQPDVIKTFLFTYIYLCYLYISRHSRSPRSRDLINNSAVARLVARGIMHITGSHNIHNIRFMRFLCQRIPQEDHKVNLIVLDLRSQLLFSSQMTCQIFMNI